MALAPTALQDAILDKGPAYSAFEGRTDEYGVTKAFIDGAPLLLSPTQVTQLRSAATRLEKVATLNRFNATLHNTYRCDPTPDDQTSAFTPLSWATIGFSAGITPAVNKGNYISEVESLQWQIQNGLRGALTSIETAGVTYFETNKSATNNYAADNVTGATNTGGIFTFPAQSQMDIYKTIPAMLQRNNLTYGKAQDVANTEAITAATYIGQQGPNNSFNTAYQVNPALADFYRSNFVGVGTGRETHYIFPKGSVGIYSWIPAEGKSQALNGLGDIDLGTEGWTSYQDPITNLTWQVRWKEGCLNGQYVISYDYTTSYAFARAYSSDNSVSPILKVNIANPANPA